MRSRWLLTLFATVPVAAAMLALQSCGGTGGPLNAGGGGLPSVTEEFLALLPAGQSSAGYIGSEACADCHGGRNGEPIYAHWQETKHAANGVGCERCHGPGSAHQAAPSDENILTFPKLTDPVVCAQCHGPINDQYKFSQHYKLIASPVERAVTSPETYGRTSRCIACHGGMFRTLTYDSGVDIATMPVEDIQSIADDILTSVPHTAVCSTCHDPHSKTGKLTDAGEDVQLRHATFSTDTESVGPGTLPQSFQTIDQICAQCHNGRGVDPSDAKLNSSTSRPSMHDSNQFNMLMGIGGSEGSGPVERNTAHANIPGQCSHCHMPDSRHSFTVSFNACVPCHTEVDAANRATSMKSEILNDLYVLRVRMSNWAMDTYGNELFWEYTSNISAEGFTPPNQAGVPIEIKRARHNYYFIVRSGDLGVHNGAYAKHLLGVANENIDNLVGPTIINRTGVSAKEKLAIIMADKARASHADLEAPND